MMASVSRKEFDCKHCMKKFKSRSGLFTHVKSHKANPKLHECPVPECGYTSVNTSNMLRHRRMVHEGERKFQCEVCAKYFGYKWVRDAHLKDEHNIGEKMKCGTCEKSFSRKSNLTQHKKTCAVGYDERPKCNLCRKTFTSYPSLRHHTKFVHPDDTAGSVCDECGEHFTTLFSLRRHATRKHSDVFPNS